jgi:hypothetical protein
MNYYAGIDVSLQASSMAQSEGRKAGQKPSTGGDGRRPIADAGDLPVLDQIDITMLDVAAEISGELNTLVKLCIVKS